MAYPRTILTQAQLTDRARGDSGARGANYVTDQDIYDWLWFAQTQLAQELEWYRTSATISTVNGTKTYDLPTLAIGIREVLLDGVPLVAQSMDDVAFGYDWYYRQQGVATPLYYWLEGNSQIALHPTPDTSASNNVTVYYTAIPPRITVTSDTYYAPPGGDEALIAYAAYRISLKDMAGEGRQRAGEFERIWHSRKAALAEQVAQVSERDFLVAGSDATLGGPYIRQIEDAVIPAP